MVSVLDINFVQKILKFLENVHNSTIEQIQKQLKKLEAFLLLLILLDTFILGNLLF